MEKKLTKPQIIETAGGEKLAVVPLAEYEAMAAAMPTASAPGEDAADAAAARAAMAALAAGEDEILTPEMGRRLDSGEHPLRVWREHRGLKLTALAKAAGISHAYLSQIEGGKREGTLAVMARLARELRIDLEDLVTADD